MTMLGPEVKRARTHSLSSGLVQHVGRYLDDESRVAVLKAVERWDDTVIPSLSNKRAIYNDDDDDDLTASPGGGGGRGGPQRCLATYFNPVALVKGHRIILPYIWVRIDSDYNGDGMPSLCIVESTITCKMYRMVLVNTKCHGRAISGLSLPVYAGSSRTLEFSPFVSNDVTHFTHSEKPTLITGSNSLISYLFNEGHYLVNAKYDDIYPKTRYEGSAYGSRVDFDIDLTICWDPIKNTLVSVHGTHTEPGAMYYVLLTNGTSMPMLYAFHADTLREVDEATTLDVYYRHPLLIK